VGDFFRLGHAAQRNARHRLLQGFFRADAFGFRIGRQAFLQPVGQVRPGLTAFTRMPCGA
jgi:hypothetical protein